ncbi:hypothetical protein STEG23_020865 [Scotinomys teguina]
MRVTSGPQKHRSHPLGRHDDYSREVALDSGGLLGSKSASQSQAFGPDLFTFQYPEARLSQAYATNYLGVVDKHSLIQHHRKGYVMVIKQCWLPVLVTNRNHSQCQHRISFIRRKKGGEKEVRPGLGRKTSVEKRKDGEQNREKGQGLSLALKVPGGHVQIDYAVVHSQERTLMTQAEMERGHTVSLTTQLDGNIKENFHISNRMKQLLDNDKDLFSTKSMLLKSDMITQTQNISNTDPFSVVTGE